MMLCCTTRRIGEIDLRWLARALHAMGVKAQPTIAPDDALIQALTPEG